MWHIFVLIFPNTRVEREQKSLERKEILVTSCNTRSLDFLRVLKGYKKLPSSLWFFSISLPPSPEVEGEGENERDSEGEHECEWIACYFFCPHFVLLVFDQVLRFFLFSLFLELTTRVLFLLSHFIRSVMSWTNFRFSPPRAQVKQTTISMNQN